MKNPVGPILRMGDEVEQVIAAIEDDNPDTDIEVIDRGAYVRVQGENQIVVTEQTLRRYLGADYELRSFGTMMTAFNGRVITTSDTITWESVGRRKSEERKTEERKSEERKTEERKTEERKSEERKTEEKAVPA